MTAVRFFYTPAVRKTPQSGFFRRLNLCKKTEKPRGDREAQGRTVRPQP